MTVLSFPKMGFDTRGGARHSQTPYEAIMVVQRDAATQYRTDAFVKSESQEPMSSSQTSAILGFSGPVVRAPKASPCERPHTETA